MTSLNTPVFKIGVILLAFIAFCITYSCTRNDKEDEGEASAHRMPADHAFVGDQSCQSCHQEEWDAWMNSDHERAMARPTEETVRGDFDDVVFRDMDDTYRFYRDGDKFLVDASGPDNEISTYEVVYTFGWEPLQQYLVDYGKGKYQALHAAWDTERNVWFSLYPEDQFKSDDWMHWTGGAMNWNTMCAECHSTNLQLNYIAEADSFHTDYESINVSCEACHGPGREHIDFMATEESSEASIDRIREDIMLPLFSSQKAELNSCAPCHSWREKLTDDYYHGDEFADHYNTLLPHPIYYQADGQLKEEAFELGSFRQSKMYQYGVKCSNCHDPHNLKLKANVVDNSLCMQCHVPSYNTPEHTFHELNTEASQCISCHMAGQYYMGVDLRHDHSFRVPRPDLSAKYGNTTNACNECHTDETAEWASQAVIDWYGPDRAENYVETLTKADAEGPAAAPDLRALISDDTQPEIIRATAIWYLSQFPDQDSYSTLEEAMASEHQMIRTSATNALENLPDSFKKPLLTNALYDSLQSVRLPALRGLAEFTDSDFEPASLDQFNKVLGEYQEYLDINQYFPMTQMSKGQFYENRGEADSARIAYEIALQKDPYFTPARMNLAYLYNNMGNNEEAEKHLIIVTEQESDYGQAYYSLALLKAEQNQLNEALPYFEQAAQYMPENGRLFYNWTIILQTLERPDESEKIYRQAIELAPENGTYRYGLITLYMQQEQFEQALEHAEILNRIQPNDPQVQQLMQMIRSSLNN
ncbi:MAG: tetratricopeptide repeat protein [Balneolales bacterium]